MQKLFLKNLDLRLRNLRDLTEHICFTYMLKIHKTFSDIRPKILREIIIAWEKAKTIDQ